MMVDIPPRLRDELDELCDEWNHQPGSLDDWAFRTAELLFALQDKTLG